MTENDGAPAERRSTARTRIDLHFALPTGEIDARGRVRLKRDASTDLGPGVGIAFEELSSAAREAIVRFCDERPPLFYEVGDRSKI
jgi:hypothetical protein